MRWMDDLSSRLSGTLQNLSTVQLRKCNSPQTPVFSSLMMGFINLCYLASNVSCPLGTSLSAAPSWSAAVPQDQGLSHSLLLIPHLLMSFIYVQKFSTKYKFFWVHLHARSSQNVVKGFQVFLKKKKSRGPVSQTMFTIILDTICLLLLFSHTCWEWGSRDHLTRDMATDRIQKQSWEPSCLLWSQIWKSFAKM